MKIDSYIKSLWCTVLLCMFMFLIIFPAHAKETEAQYSSIIKNIKLEVLEKEPEKQVIDVFDVRDDGWFVVGLNTQEICIYDQNGIYQYGFRININGIFAVEFLRENVVVYLVRGNKAVCLDKNGTCVSYIDRKPEYISQLLNRSKIHIEGDTYILERNVGIFRGDYARLVKISQTDDRTVLYDASSVGLVVGIWHYIVVMGVIACFIFGIVFVLKKKLSLSAGDCSTGDDTVY